MDPPDLGLQNMYIVQVYPQIFHKHWPLDTCMASRTRFGFSSTFYAVNQWVPTRVAHPFSAPLKNIF